MSRTKRMWYQKIYAVCKAQPWRLAITLLFCLIAIYYFKQHEVIIGLLALNVALQALYLGVIPQQRYEQEFVPDVMAELKIEQDMLHVKQRQLKLADIKTVALDQLDKDYAFIDFPFNVYRATAMRFPAEQLPAVKTWLQQHLPQAEIIR
ncbi:hypothetical protein ACO1PK_06890 [Alishewanella sp. d11]|uniref:hypothetical protein n=1 Tax=Alishewanella sp. d11 TaxID=3414030 RepID=UPI003BF7E73F